MQTVASCHPLDMESDFGLERTQEYWKKMPDILRMLDLEGRNIPVEDAEFVSAGAIAHRKADGAKSE